MQWVYGYPPHFADFGPKPMRWGGWRPQVFTYHGLVLSKLMLAITIAAAALWLGKQKESIWGYAAKNTTGILAATVILCKSTGVWIYLFFFSFLFLRTSTKTQMRTLVVISVFVLAYPYGRAFGYIQVETLIAEINKVMPERAHSLAFRFRNEEEVAVRVQKKLWVGWGGWGRGHIWDAEQGKDLTVIDGYWLIRF